MLPVAGVFSLVVCFQSLIGLSRVPPSRLVHSLSREISALLQCLGAELSSSAAPTAGPGLRIKYNGQNEKLATEIITFTIDCVQ